MNKWIFGWVYEYVNVWLWKYITCVGWIYKGINEYTSRWYIFVFVNEGMNSVFVFGILWFL